jgi:hypothetical protein
MLTPPGYGSGMDSEMNFAGMMRDHDEIDAMTFRLERCCKAPDPCPDDVLDARLQLKEVLADHLRREDESIYPQLMSAGGKSSEAVAEFVENFAYLLADWQDYLADWGPQCVVEDWLGFCEETAAMMARVRERTRAETELIYPLALQSGAIRLRDRA